MGDWRLMWYIDMTIRAAKVIERKGLEELKPETLTEFEQAIATIRQVIAVEVMRRSAL